MTAFSYDAITIDVLADGRPALLSVYRNHVRMAVPLERAVAYGVAGELGLAVRGAAILGLPGPVTVNVEESVGASGAAIASWIAQALRAALHRAAVDAGVSYEIAELRVDDALRDPRSTSRAAFHRLVAHRDDAAHRAQALLPFLNARPREKSCPG
jgi:hypothetical protein